MILWKYLPVSDQLLVVAYSDLVKFLHVVGVYCQKFKTLKKGKGNILCFLKHSQIKGEPADIPVEILILAHDSRLKSKGKNPWQKHLTNATDFVFLRKNPCHGNII